MLTSTLTGTLLALGSTLPLAWKWGLGVRRAAAAVTLLSALSGVIVGFMGSLFPANRAWRSGLVWLLTLTNSFAILAYRFYRDPQRSIAEYDDVIVSPADGEVIYVRESSGGMLPVSTKLGRNYPLQELTKTPLNSADAVVVGVGMNFLDVHVNRAPIAGRITLQRHYPGLFGSLRRAEMVFENERATTLIERDGLQVAVVQIASRLVRQIVSFVRQGDDVNLGERIGAIRFGSQVDLVLPARQDLRIVVQPGDRVMAGLSIMAVLEGSECEGTELAPEPAQAGGVPCL